MRGARLASERVLVIKEQILGINYNLGKFQASGELRGSEVKLRVPWKDLGFGAAIPKASPGPGMSLFSLCSLS